MVGARRDVARPGRGWQRLRPRVASVKIPSPSFRRDGQGEGRPLGGRLRRGTQRMLQWRAGHNSITNAFITNASLPRPSDQREPGPCRDGVAHCLYPSRSRMTARSRGLRESEWRGWHLMPTRQLPSSAVAEPTAPHIPTRQRSRRKKADSLTNASPAERSARAGAFTAEVALDMPSRLQRNSSVAPLEAAMERSVHDGQSELKSSSRPDWVRRQALTNKFLHVKHRTPPIRRGIAELVF